MPTLALLHQKGGAGKTTLATNLAAAAHLAGRRTLLIDLDGQGSSTDWSARRPEGGQLDGLTVVPWGKKKLPLPRFRELSAGYDMVVLDGPGGVESVSVSLALLADLVVVPCQPSGFDLWACVDTAKMLDEADEMREQMGKPAARRLFVLNRMDADSLSEAAPSAFADAGEVSDVRLWNRVAFRRAGTEGGSVLTIEPQGKAAGEVKALYEDVLRRLTP